MSESLLEQITAATAGEYELAGELGENGRGTAFLAREVVPREVAAGRLVVLLVPPAADALEVLAAVGEDVPANAGRCTACGYAPMVWLSHCPNCARPFVLAPLDTHRFTLTEVGAATAHAYEVVGELAHVAGGSLFFVRDRADGRLVALAGQVDAAGQEVLDPVWDAAAPSHVGGATAVPADAGGADGRAAFVAAGDDLGAAPAAGPVPVRGPRRWAGAAAAVALLALGGGAWAYVRSARDAGAAPVGAGGDGGAVALREPSTGPALPEPARPGAGALGGDQPAAATATPGAAVDSAALRPAAARGAAARAAAEGTRAEEAARRPGELVLATAELPVGWRLRVDGRPRRGTSPTVSLTPRVAHTLTVEASGYCPAAVRVTLEPGARQEWAPQLTGRPGIGECPGEGAAGTAGTPGPGAPAARVP